LRNVDRRADATYEFEGYVSHSPPKALTSWRRFWAVSAILFLACPACTRKPPTVQNYQSNGVQFSYYSDWSITKDAAVKNKPKVRSIQLRGPRHALVTLTCVPASSRQTLEQFAEAVAVIRKTKIEQRLSLGSFKIADVDKGGSEPVTGRVGGHDQTGIHQWYSVELGNTSVPCDVKLFLLPGTKYKVMIMCQVPQKDLNTCRPAMDLVVDSLRIEGSE
jgi:hypothetical protein